MKKLGIVAAIIFIVVMVFVYLKIGKKGADEATIYVDTTAGNIQKARSAINEMNKSIEEAQKAADRALGR